MMVGTDDGVLGMTIVIYDPEMHLFFRDPLNRDRSFQFNGRYVHPRKRRQHS